VRQLAQAEVMMFMDGGVSLPFGQEMATFDLLDTYRRLPPVPFLTLQSQESIQPLTVRYRNFPNGTIVYIVNDAPFAVEADFFFTADASSTITELTGRRMIRSFGRSPQHGNHTWRATLQPYDLLAVQISDANASIASVSVHRPPEFFSPEGRLKQKVDDFDRRIQSARQGVRWEGGGFFNGDFEFDAVFRNDSSFARVHVREEPTVSANNIFGWQCFGNSLTAQFDTVAVYKGQRSAKLTNSSAEPGMFVSVPLDVPATGRLAVSMWVGIPAESRSLPMSVVLTRMCADRPFHRSVPVGESLMPFLLNATPNNGVRWHQLIVPFERLPTESLEGVQIGVQLSDAAIVWLDDVALYPARFSENEMRELQRKLVVAHQRYTSGRVSDLISLLEGHWAQFLFEHVPAAEFQRIASRTPPPVTNTPPPAPERSPTMMQRVRGAFGL